MTESVDGGKNEGFKLNEAGLAYFGDLAPVFEELMREYGAEDEKTLLAEPRLSIDLAGRTKNGIERLAEFLVRRVVGKTILFGVNDRGEKRPKKACGDPIEELAILNDKIFIENFPIYANPSVSTPEGVFLNRLLRAVRGMLIACFVRMSNAYNSKKKALGRSKKLPKDDLKVIAFYEIIGFDFNDAINAMHYLGMADSSTMALLQMALTMHGMREFIEDHKLTVPRDVDAAKLKEANGRIFEVIDEFRDPGIPLVVNPKQEGKIFERTVSEVSPLRTDSHEFGRVLAQVIFFDEAHAQKTDEIESLAAVNLRPVQEGAQSFAITALQKPNGRMAPGSMQFLVSRFDGEISSFDTDPRALKILLGDSLYEIARNAVLIELAQIVCRRDVLQKYLGDLLDFDPARKPTFGRSGYRGGKSGAESKKGPQVRNFPKIYQAMMDNAEPSEPTGIERGPISPHARLLPQGRYPSEQAVTSAMNAGEITKKIPDEIRGRDDVKTRIRNAVGFGYAVSWYETSDRPEHAGRLIRRDVRSDEIEETAAREGISVNDVINSLIAEHRDQNAALRFYTYVSREDPGTVDAIRGKTEVSAGDVIAGISGRDQKSS